MRFQGHPLHPVLCHLPIGAWGASAVWDALALLGQGSHFWDFSRASIALGLLAAVPAAVTGFVDYLALPNDHPAEKTATLHLLVMSSTVCVYLASLLARGTEMSAAGPGPGLALALSALGLLLLGVGGWLGGELVYRHAVGIKSPETMQGNGQTL